jgi:hypothetical protein
MGPAANPPGKSNNLRALLRFIKSIFICVHLRSSAVKNPVHLRLSSPWHTLSITAVLVSMVNKNASNVQCEASASIPIGEGR